MPQYLKSVKAGLVKDIKLDFESREVKSDPKVVGISINPLDHTPIYE